MTRFCDGIMTSLRLRDDSVYTGGEAASTLGCFSPMVCLFRDHMRGAALWNGKKR